MGSWTARDKSRIQIQIEPGVVVDKRRELMTRSLDVGASKIRGP